MMNKAKTVVKQVLHNLGWDLRRFQPTLTSGGQTVSALTQTEINVVFDVGANGSSGFAMGKCSWAGEDGRGGMAIDRSKVPGIQGIR
jgi:hypothetical protein